MHVEAWGLNHSLYLPYVMHGRPPVAASFSLRPQDSLWDGAHDARLTGDVVDEIPGGKVDRADWSGVPDDLGDGVCPHHKLSLPYRALSSCQIAQVFKDDATRILKSCVLSFTWNGQVGFARHGQFSGPGARYTSH